MSKETEIYTVKVQQKEWKEFNSLIRALINDEIDSDDLFSICFNRQTKLNLQLENLENGDEK